MKVTSRFPSFHRFCFSIVREKWHPLSSKNLVPRGLPGKHRFLKVEREGSYAKVVRCETFELVAMNSPKCWTTNTKSEVGNFFDFDVCSCKRCCMVYGAVSASCKKKAFPGESPPTIFWSQADRLWSGHSRITGREVQWKANIPNYVKIPWRSSCVLPPCNMFLCEHPVMFLFHIQVPRCFLGGGMNIMRPVICGPWAVSCSRRTVALTCSKENVTMKL